MFCKSPSNLGYDLNLCYVYSIQAKTNTKKCRNIYTAPNETEVIKITEYDKILLRLNDHIHEWNLRDGSTTVVLDNIPEVN